MSAEQSRRDAHRDCPVSSCCAPWTGQCLVAVRGWSSPASRPRNGGVECPIRNAKTKRFARGRFARGERAGKRTPGARSRRRTAWRRVVPRTGRVGEKRGSDCGSRLGGPVRRRRLFSVSCLTASPVPPGFVTCGDPESENGRLDVSRHRSRTSDVESGARRQSAGARLLSVSHPGPVPFGYPWGTSLEAGFLSRWAARRACRTPGRAAPRPPRGRRRDSASPGGIRSWRSARPSDSPRRGARRWSSARASSARRGETPISSVRAAKATRPERRGLPSGRPRGTPRTTRRV